MTQGEHATSVELFSGCGGLALGISRAGFSHRLLVERDADAAATVAANAARGVTHVANWPYTLLGIMPTNHRLKAIAEADAGPATRAMLETWGRLPAVRTALGFAATSAYLWALH